MLDKLPQALTRFYCSFLCQEHTKSAVALSRGNFSHRLTMKPENLSSKRLWMISPAFSRPPKSAWPSDQMLSWVVPRRLGRQGGALTADTRTVTTCQECRMSATVSKHRRYNMNLVTHNKPSHLHFNLTVLLCSLISRCNRGQLQRAELTTVPLAPTTTATHASRDQ